MAKILIIHSTTDAHTRTIGERLQQVIARAGHEAALLSASDEAQVDLASFDRIITGASIRYGLYKPAILDFVVRNNQLLDSKLNYPRYRFIDRQLIRLIMLMTKGPTASKAVIEFTDWQQVEALGRRVCEVPA